MVACRLQGAFNLRLRRLVGSHRIQSNDSGHVRRKLGLLSNLEYFAALVVSALRAGAVRHLVFVAIRTLRQRVFRQRVMRAARGRALLGVSAFWIGHENFCSRFSVFSSQ